MTSSKSGGDTAISLHSLHLRSAAQMFILGWGGVLQTNIPEILEFGHSSIFEQNICQVMSNSGNPWITDSLSHTTNVK